MKYGPITIDRERMNGTPLFEGTDVPVKAFFEYLEDERPVTGYLDTILLRERIRLPEDRNEHFVNDLFFFVQRAEMNRMRRLVNEFFAAEYSVYHADRVGSG